MINKQVIIAIDGFSSCGKSTLAKDLASKLNYIYIDSGAMYRAVTLYCIENDIINNADVNYSKLKNHLKSINISFEVNPLSKSNITFLNNKNVEDKIRDIEVSENVSFISKIDIVRSHLVQQQKKMGENKGIIMDGRDIGTVVFPNAEIKIFVTADVDVRAKRRYDELIAKKSNVTLNEIKANIEKRDYIDQNREISPLRKAEDAIVLDNSNFSREEQLKWVLEKINTILV